MLMLPACLSRILSARAWQYMRGNWRIPYRDAGLLQLLFALIFDRLKSPRRVEIENLYCDISSISRGGTLRNGADCAELIEHSFWITRLWPNLLNLTRVGRPDTILRWHRVSRILASDHVRTRGDVARQTHLPAIRCQSS
jgi:hypothetical protein